jgi:hypothetical protein
MYVFTHDALNYGVIPVSSVKNSVPFLFKVDPAKIAAAVPRTFQTIQIPLGFTTMIAEVATAQLEQMRSEWPGLAAKLREEGEITWQTHPTGVTTGAIEDLAKLFLRGETSSGATISTGGSRLKELDAPDRPNILIDDQFKHTDYQRGIPLEYRRVREMPDVEITKEEILDKAVSELEQALFEIINQVRELDLMGLEEGKKKKIEERF